ncbi:MAG: D-Ala-D-Ala carboxypeptidase family metallohydrolase [Methanobacterium sp.]
MRNLTKNFTLEELIGAGSAKRLGGKEQFNPNQSVINNLTDLCVHVLQPLRDYLGHPITITSGYRSLPVNTGVGGAKNSDHLYGNAADIQMWIDGKNCNQMIFDAVIKLGLNFKQMIDEFGTDENPAWIHISYDAGNNRKEILRAVKNNGKTIYKRIKV